MAHHAQEDGDRRYVLRRHSSACPVNHPSLPSGQTTQPANPGKRPAVVTAIPGKRNMRDAK